MRPLSGDIIMLPQCARGKDLLELKHGVSVCKPGTRDLTAMEGTWTL